MSRDLALRIGLILAAIAGAVVAPPAEAHMTPNSEVMLDIGHGKILAGITVSLSELGYAVGDIALADGAFVPAEQLRLERYFLARVGAVAPRTGRWSERLQSLRLVPGPGGYDVQADIMMTPPPGTSPRQFDLLYSAVIDRVPSHVALIFIRADYDGGHLSEHPRLLGGLQQGSTTMPVDLGGGHPWRGFLAAIMLGVHHIAVGHDHLLFLFALLLPAPLIAIGGRWAAPTDLRTTARHLIGIVTAFTIGHSATLIAGAFANWRLPGQPVEVMIAVSILISAIHAWRPIFAGREPLVAGGFGLIHGLAFATVIGAFGLEPLQKAQSILGFNLGIELVQLGVVAVVAPLLVLLARSARSYAIFRTTAAALAAVAAVAWIVERVMGQKNPAGRAIDAALDHAPWIIAGLAGAALIAGVMRPSAPRTSATRPSRNHPTARS